MSVKRQLPRRTRDAGRGTHRRGNPHRGQGDGEAFRHLREASCFSMRKYPASGPLSGALSLERIMDIEQINAIGTTLADLQARTAALRGYL